ncbi:MAG: OadG family transporter subunit [Dehalococcoidia bacterium]|nr:OadG family transporter subunit [Dehalococcoidia bacterium]
MIAALWIVLLGMAIIFVVLGVLLAMMLLVSRLIKPEAKEKR